VVTFVHIYFYLLAHGVISCIVLLDVSLCFFSLDDSCIYWNEDKNKMNLS
jgi:hypothetical protein